MRNIKQATNVVFDQAHEVAMEYTSNLFKGTPESLFWDDEEFEREIYHEVHGLVMKEIIVKLYERVKSKN